MRDKCKISGRIINASTNLPHVITRNASTGEYGLRQRRGNSAFYSAINYLHNDTDWESILVAWAGEVEINSNTEFKRSHPNVGKHQDKSETKSFGPISEDEGYVLGDDDKLHLERQLIEASGGSKVVPIWMENSGGQLRWREYAENIIWPTLHYIQRDFISSGCEENDWWNDYVKLNETYRDKILEIYRPGDIIWIHDYYLFLLPQLLRMSIPDGFIGMFIHSPFPSSEYFRCMSKRKELLEGILGSSLVATQSYAYSRHFISACTRILGVEEAGPTFILAYGIHISVETIPIGIDTKKVENDAFRPEVDEKARAIRNLYPDKKIIVGRDRLDSVRGVVQKLEAFEIFLKHHPEWINKVVLIQVTSPAYSIATRIDTKVNEIISRINGTFGSLNFLPVHHYPRHISRDEYLALLRVADLGLITSIRDGMNTTSLEFVVCQKYNHSPIILSEFTGTAGSLLDSIQVNPWDPTEVAETINQTLLLTKKQNKSRQGKLYNYVTTHPVQHWMSTLITRLIFNLVKHERSHVTPVLDLQQLISSYQNANRRLFLFDYDGTLTPIVKEPSAAIPSTRLYETLQRLSDDPRNVMWIISGRDTQFLDKWFGNGEIKRLGFSAEHGCFLKEAGKSEWTNLANDFDMSWQDVVYEVMNSYTERTQGSNIEQKRAALTWHYRRSDPDFGSFQAKNLRQHLEETVVPKFDVEVMAGKANVEVRPRQVNKGEIVKRILSESETRPEFIICLGDDQTDEDMFRALQELNDDPSKATIDAKPERRQAKKGIYPVTVGPPSKMTVASWHLLNPTAVLDTLCALADS